jgi:chromosome segregation ATPase
LGFFQGQQLKQKAANAERILYQQEATMSDRDVYVEKMKTKIDEWNADLAKLEARSREANADMRLKYDEKIQELKGQRERAEEQMKELQRASEESWKRMRDGMESAWDEINRAFREAADRFR